MAQYLHQPCEKRLFGVVDITRRKEPKMKYIMTSTAVAALVALPVTAQAQFFGSGFDNSSVLGGLAGAGIGGALGSNLAGSGNRDEGTAIGAALGGLAGVGFGNSRSRYGNNPFAGSFNPGFTGNSLLGTGAGAAVGCVIGSNLAGSGVRQEGTAIGAVLGGLAGYGLANRGGQNAGFAPAGFNGGFGTPAFGNAGIIGGGLGLPPRGGVSFAPSGQFVSGPVIPVTRYTQPAVTRRIVVTQPRRIAAPRPVIRRAPAPIPTTVVSVAPRVQQRPVVRATRVVVPVPSTYADCPAGMKLLKNGSCLETTNTIVAKPVARRGTLRPLSAAGLSAPISAPAPAPVQRISVAAAPAPVQYANCPSGTTKQSDGSCLEATSYSAPAPVYSAPAPVFTQQAPAASCPAGTTTQPDGTCLEPTVYSAPAPVYTPPAPVLCPSGTTKQSDGTCLSPTIRQSESSYVAPAPVYTAPAPVSSASTVMAITPETFAYEQAPLTSKSQTLVTTTPSVGASSQEYCYGDGGKRYDSLGREIQAGSSGCAY